MLVVPSAWRSGFPTEQDILTDSGAVGDHRPVHLHIEGGEGRVLVDN